MATSGTVSTTTFNTGKVIDHVARRCRLAPQQVTSEHIQTILDILYLMLSTLASKGIALWRIQKDILPLYSSVSTVPCPIGTVDLLNANLRTLQRITGVYSATEGDADLAFDADVETECVQTTPAGYIQIEYPSGTQITTYGILPGASGTWDLSILISEDGVTFTSVYTNAELAVVDGEWFWLDLQGQPAINFVRLKANNTTILDVREFVTANLPNEIPMYKMNRDDYSNLPDKTFDGRPVQFWYNKQRARPLIELWPAPQYQFTFAQIVTYTQQYIQDVGTMTDDLDIPQRWFLAIICETARQAARSIKEVQLELIPDLDKEADLQMRMAWDSETDSSRARFTPNLKPYTA